MSFSSSGSLWHFVEKHPRWVSGGLVGIHSFDAMSERLLLSRRFSFAKSWKTILGHELTVTLLEESFQGYSLFSENCHIQVLHAEKMPSGTSEYLLGASFKIKSGCLVLAFAKESAFFKKLAKKFPNGFFKIESPKFWEADNLLKFFCQELQIPLSVAVQTYLVEVLPMNSIDYVTALNRIKLHFPNTKGVDVSQVKELVTPCKLDQFALASLFARRKVVPFLKIISESNMDFASLCSLFSFMQRHLLRLLDPSYVKHKSRPSKYDREIVNHAKLWQPTELCRQMKLFGKLEIAAKKRSGFLKAYLRALQTSVLK